MSNDKPDGVSVCIETFGNLRTRPYSFSHELAIMLSREIFARVSAARRKRTHCYRGFTGSPNGDIATYQRAMKTNAPAQLHQPLTAQPNLPHLDFCTPVGYSEMQPLPARDVPLESASCKAGLEFP
jgi:hypothetical protein